MLTYDVPLIMSGRPELSGHLPVPRVWPHVNAGGSMTRGGGEGGEGASGLTVLQYWAFFQTVFNFGNFDFNVPYCGIISPAVRGFSG